MLGAGRKPVVGLVLPPTTNLRKELDMIIYCDGSNTVYCIIVDDNEPQVFDNPSGITHNESEYLAILKAVQVTVDSKVKSCTIISDSLLSIRQVQRQWKVREPRLQSLRDKILAFVKSSDADFTFEWVPRRYNKAGIHLESLK